MINLEQLTLRRGTQLLFQDVNWTIYHKQRIGLVGANGSGKSSLFALLLGEMAPDMGDFSLPAKLNIAHVAQETPGLSISALDFVMAGDAELAEINQQLRRAEEAEDGTKIAVLHEKLAGIDGYTATARAAQLLVGLGFTHAEHAKSVAEFSGGWRVRLNLARALMARSDILLLDEPTNHLDLDTVMWLEGWLNDYQGTLLLISHDRDFLDKTVDHVAHIHRQAIKLYSGNYSTFEKTYAQALQIQQATHEKQQKKVQHMMSFVNRFKAKATKAKQAQSRMKAIERMDLVCAVQAESPFQFNFRQPDACPYPMLQVQRGVVQYGDHRVLSQLNVSIKPGDRIGLLGPNGAGKSSLIKLLAGDIEATQGIREAAPGLKIGYFAQHQIDNLILSDTVLAHLHHLAPTLSEVELRTYLGGYGFRNDDVFKKVNVLSGGEKSRLALALLVWHKPNLLLMDEPTNHLDLNMRTALSLALQAFPGAMIIVSHDRYLLRSTVDEFFLVANGAVAPFAGDLADYQKWLVTYRQQDKDIIVDDKSTLSKKQIRQLEAQEREKRRPLEQKIKNLEKSLAKHEKKLAQIELDLTDLSLYEDDQKQKLQSILHDQVQVKKEIQRIETEWMALHD